MKIFVFSAENKAILKVKSEIGNTHTLPHICISIGLKIFPPYCPSMLCQCTYKFLTLVHVQYNTNFSPMTLKGFPIFEMNII